MLPDWAPNLHPVVIHFPIVLVLAAVAADWMDLLLRRTQWLGPMAASLYVAGAAGAGVAYWTGTRAAATVYVPGMANPMIENHEEWALATLIFVGLLALARLLTSLRGATASGRLRWTLALAGLLAAVLIQQTGERGARLVYEQGVGVVAPPRTR